MRQVLFRLPIPGLSEGIPFYGFGVMLFIAFILCMWLATWRAKKEGIPPTVIHDLAIWLFVAGIIGARAVYMIQYKRPIQEFFVIWQGGLVFYGSALGGLAGFILAHFFLLRKNNVPTWKLVDILAPCIALGLCLGRFGCLLNGCCYGNVACAHCPPISFPLSAPARFDLVREGLQTAAGFTLASATPTAGDLRRVTGVESGSPAELAGLRVGDIIVKADDVSNKIAILVRPPGKNLEEHDYDDPQAFREGIRKWQAQGVPIVQIYDHLSNYLAPQNWPRSKTDLKLTVIHADGNEEELPAFQPRTLGLHPTQLYESMSMALLLILLLALYPLRRHDGEVMAVFMLGYATHRFLNEMLRNDTNPVLFQNTSYALTLSQTGSIIVFLSGLTLLAWLWTKPAQYPAVPLKRSPAGN